MYEKVNAFDTNNKERIYNLLVLKGEALIKGHFLAYKQGMVEGQGYSNFFTAISNQIDLLLVYFINDEISASLHERGPINELRDELIDEFYKDEDYKRLELAKNDLFDLFSKRTDFIIGSNFLDFKVNTFSVFECYVDELYEELITISPRSNKKEEELVKLIERYSSESDLEKKRLTLEKIKGVNFYVSSAEKINYVLSKCDMEKEELAKAREFLNYYRSQRNTVHNLGIHKGKSQTIVVDGIKINLEQDLPSFTNNHNSATFACRQLMKIYEVMLSRVRGVIVF
ncbi:TPA: hypothetical protein ACPVXQ_004607 [Vibrio parahaemolyticus]|uniref:hypothetical protein n=1 Tax=Vibrio parahaemolyticus TaxID=670 RepID=UPI00038E1434|nr:hypothetical protein [Vibrio parahaemolyticus]EGR1122506.1 hypothetical protein [Vibrio parahaemolyticus]EQM13005.1 hypothetical protein D024_1253 [Vibrio parahaemolyticus 3259]ETJ85045.1 hypothetical protein D041_4888 [Vibrio parahaemolyticus EKP-008]ODX80212.1 hypothetical protein BBM12_06625 [Vibrio parahaemolyticus]ODX90243.1 hypothetical protein BBM93_06300 [Vibrio parahaemolyticus]